MQLSSGARQAAFALVATVWLAAVVAARPRAADLAQAPATPGSPVAREVLTRYCETCHNDRLRSGGLTLTGLDVDHPDRDAATWEKMVRKLRARMMPPVGMPRPDEATYGRLVGALESALDAAAARQPDPGNPVVHRLNRAEYANAVRELLALEVDAATLLPPDDSAYGFDNVSDVLNVSPVLQERYLAAARKISAMALGDAGAVPAETIYRVRQDLSQNQHVEGLPLGTIGGALVRHTFPVDGEYLFQARLFRTNLGMMRGLEYPHEIEYTVDGARVHAAAIGGTADLSAAFEKPTETGDAMEARLRVRVRVKAGLREVGLAFVEELPAVDTVRLQPFLRSSYDTLDWTGRPHIEMFSITGPFDASGSGDTPSRRRVLTCRPQRANEEPACATRILSTLLQRAYRRPAGDADVKNAMRFYHAGRLDGSFDSGIQAALQYILASPNFVFRVERDPAAASPGTPYRISDLELASRLSFFLWSGPPDDELLNAAIAGRLTHAAEREKQVRRMLSDRRARALVTNFAGQWLQLRNVRTVLPNSEVFPDFDDNLRQALLRETEMLLESVIREDRNVLDLLRADYTFVNERLARHYGIPGVYGSRFRRIEVPTDARRGLLGHGSILAVTSHAERTSPVLRGKWILENLLGTPAPPPPPDVPALEDKSEKARTVRERLERHRANPACASCHQIMDPLGFALEHFDAVGAWRNDDEGSAIDASGQLADGARVDGVVAVREAILRRPDLFVSTMTEKMLTYALGRGLDHRDMPVVRRIVAASARRDYRVSSLVLGIVESVPFQMRKAERAADAR